MSIKQATILNQGADKTQTVLFTDLGIIDYNQAWQLQEVLLQKIILEKKTLDFKLHSLNHLLLCEHPHVYTLGKSGKQDNLLINENQLSQNQATFYKINRGGDITYHGPGQVVGYPILNLDLFFNDIHKYMRCLEEIIIRTLAEYNLKGERIEKLTGVWLDAGKPSVRKICAFGVRCSRWVTMHGWALNVNTDLNYFNNIVPCGISDKAVTSMQKELGKVIDINEVKQKLKKHFADVFGVLFDEISYESLLLKNNPSSLQNTH